MRLFKKDEPVKTITIPSRVERMETHSLYEWMSTTIMGLGAAFDQWRYHQRGRDEFEEHLESLTVLWEEMKKRVDKTA